MSIHERFKETVHKSGKSQKEIAEICNVTHQYLSQAIGGKNVPSIKLLTAVSKETGVNLHWILTGEGEMYIGGNVSSSEKELKEENESLRKQLFELQNKLISMYESFLSQRSVVNVNSKV